MIGLLELPQWGQYLIEGIFIFIEISAAAVVLTRLGRSPYFAFLAVIPYVPVIGFWYLAFTGWPPALKKTA